MKYFFQILFFSTLSFNTLAQNFGKAEKEELIYRSLKEAEYVDECLDSTKNIFVLVDTVDQHLQDFIQKKFASYNWNFVQENKLEELYKGSDDFNIRYLNIE